MPLKDYEEFAAEPLAFPIRGKVYTPPEVGARTGLMLIKAFAGDADALAGDARSLWQMLLGPAYDRMLEDNVPIEALARAGFAMLVDWEGDREAAIRVWESGIDPEARAAVTAALRQKASMQSTNSASGRKTRSQASTRATTSRAATPRKPAKATGSRTKHS